MGMHNNNNTTTAEMLNDYGVDSSVPAYQNALVSDWVEVWDYVGGIRFRGFVAESAHDKAMVAFFDQNVVGSDLKAG